MTNRGDDGDGPQRFTDENPLGKRRADARGVAPAMARPESRRPPAPPRGGDAPVPEKVQPPASRGLTVMRPGDVPVPPPPTLPAEWLPPKASDVQQPRVQAGHEPEVLLPGADADAPPVVPSTVLARAGTLVRARLLPLLRTPQGIAAIGAVALLVGVVVAVGVGGADQGDTTVYVSEQFSVEEQARLGAAWRSMGIGSWGGALNDDVVTRHVNAVGSAVVAGFGDDARKRPLTFLVVRDAHAIHAFGLPGDTVVVSAGLLWWLKSDAELAAVLAHMVAHQLLGHPQRALDAFAAPDVAEEVHTALGAPAGSQDAVLAAIAEAAATGVNGYDAEAAADHLADEALEAAGFDRQALRRVVVDRFASAGGRVAWLVQHPAPPGRKAALAALPAGGRVGDAAYVTEVITRIDRRRQPVAPTTPAAPTAAPATTTTPAPPATPARKAPPANPGKNRR